jgi:type I restriction enzyme S subunit
LNFSSLRVLQSLSQCSDFDFTISSIEEQQEIVRRVRQLFAFADKVESRYIKAKAMLDKLPQSILAKAFRVELVPQNTDDEPVDMLIERI